MEKIKFYCRSFNKELYLLSSSLYKKYGYECVRLTDQNADGYFYTMLNDKECDIAINVDEDCFITSFEYINGLAEKAIREGLVNIGCSDAGEGCPRHGDRDVTNPFFNILNLKLIREKWDKERITEFSQWRLKTYEPYYAFFKWMNKQFPEKTLYLKSRKHNDGITTLLYDVAEEESNGNIICEHTWFAREYNPSVLTKIFERNPYKEVDHQKRINMIIDEVYSKQGIERPSYNYIDKIGFHIDALIRWSHKIPVRVRDSSTLRKILKKKDV